MPLPVQMRVPITGLTFSSAAHFSLLQKATNVIACTAEAFDTGTVNSITFTATVSAGLTAGEAVLFHPANASATIICTGAEL